MGPFLHIVEHYGRSIIIILSKHLDMVITQKGFYDQDSEKQK